MSRKLQNSYHIFLYVRVSVSVFFPLHESISQIHMYMSQYLHTKSVRSAKTVIQKFQCQLKLINLIHALCKLMNADNRAQLGFSYMEGHIEDKIIGVWRDD